MNFEHLIQELEELAQHMGIRIRFEKGDFKGGYCILKEEKVVVINKRLHEMKKASVLAQALGEIGIEQTYVKPNLREFIEDEIAKATKEA